MCIHALHHNGFVHSNIQNKIKHSKELYGVRMVVVEMAKESLPNWIAAGALRKS